MKNLFKTAIALTAIVVAVKAKLYKKISKVESFSMELTSHTKSEAIKSMLETLELMGASYINHQFDNKKLIVIYKWN